MKYSAGKITAVLLLVITAGHASARDYFSKELYMQLEKEGEITRTFSGRNRLSLIPDLDLSREIIADVNSLDPKIGVEILYMIDMPEHIKAMSADERNLHLYNSMRKISSMQGIEYYSRSREKMRLLFEESFMVDALKSKTALPDSLVKSIPEKDRLICFQKDLSFGKNYYQLDYSCSAEAVSLRYMNLDSMYYSLIRAVAPENLHIHLLVLCIEDRIVIYSVSAADVFSLFGFDKKVEGSFYERLKAIRNWFIDII